MYRIILRLDCLFETKKLSIHG